MRRAGLKNGRILTTASDAELVLRSRSGDDRAFAELVRRYHGEVYGLALRSLKNPDDAQDLAQEAFLRAFRALDRFDPSRRFGAWLYAITARLCIDVHRQKRSRFVSLNVPEAGSAGEEREWELPDASPGPLEEAEQTEMAAHLEAHISRLSPDYRVAILLRHAHDLSYEEIAEALDTPVGTIKARIHRARAQLRAWLEGGELDPGASESSTIPDAPASREGDAS